MKGCIWLTLSLVLLKKNFSGCFSPSFSTLKKSIRSHTLQMTKDTTTDTLVCAENPEVHHFMSTIVDLQQKNSQAARLFPDDSQVLASFKTTNINSLVLQIDSSGSYILVIIESRHRVDVDILQEKLVEKGVISSESKVALAPSDAVQSLCGFRPGCVPPLGFLNPPIATVVDFHIGDHLNLQGGGGSEELSCVVALDTLLALPNTLRLCCRVESADSKRSTSLDCDPIPDFSAFKPFFVVQSPPVELVREVLERKESSVKFESEWIQIVGRISGIRRISRQLVFVDFAPPSGTHGSQDLPWRDPRTGADMAVQIICGQTYFRRVGNETLAEDSLRRLKIGQLVMVHGRTNVGSMDSLRHWIQKGSLDVALWDYQLLEQATRRSDAEFSASQSSRRERILESKKAKDTKRNDLPILSVSSAYTGGNTTITVVDSAEGLAGFENSLSIALQRSEQYNEDLFDDTSRMRLVGIDCEWRPSFYSVKTAQPVLILQVCFHCIGKVFLFDLQALLRPMLHPSEPLNHLESTAASLLGRLFSSRQLVKVGFQVNHDLKKLSASYPHLSTLRSYESVLDAAVLTKRVFHALKRPNTREVTGSLRSLTEHLLSSSLDKSEQISDWAERPLTTAQIEYAALDAIVTPMMVEQLVKMSDSASSQEYVVRDGLLKSWRFVFLLNNNNFVIRKLRAESVIADELLVTQHWSTGSSPPREPQPPDSVSSTYVDAGGRTRIPATSLKVNLESTCTLLDSLVGQRMGKSKEKCLDKLLVENSEISEGALLEYNSRSGYIELANAVILFVNMPKHQGRGGARSYPNEWLQDGRYLTWFMKETDWSGGSSQVAGKMAGAERELVALFVRSGRGHYICCGRCSVSQPPQEEQWPGRLKALTLGLENWEELCKYADFHRMVFPGNELDGCLIFAESSSSESD